MLHAYSVLRIRLIAVVTAFSKHLPAQGKRKRAKEAKPADAAKQDDSISLEDLADRMDVDWKVRRNCHATHFLHKQWCFFLKFQPHVTMQGHVEHA